MNLAARLGRLTPALTPKERFLMVLRARQAGEEPEPGLNRLDTLAERKEYDSCVALTITANNELGTLAWGLGLFYLFSKLEFLGRNDGISGIPPLSVGALKMIDPGTIYYAIWLAVLIAALLTVNLLDSRTGRAIRALRRGHIAAEAFGVHAPRAKLLVFIYAAVLAGLSGWLYAHFERAVNPTPFGAEAGIEYLFIAVVGGAGYVWGGVLGAAIVVVLKEILQSYLPLLLHGEGQLEIIVFGILLVALLQLAPSGVWPWLLSWLPLKPRRKRPDPQLALPPRPRAPAGPDMLLQIDKACKQFGGVIAVNNVSFEVGSREIDQRPHVPENRRRASVGAYLGNDELDGLLVGLAVHQPLHGVRPVVRVRCGPQDERQLGGRPVQLGDLAKEVVVGVEDDGRRLRDRFDLEGLLGLGEMYRVDGRAVAIDVGVRLLDAIAIVVARGLEPGVTCPRHRFDELGLLLGIPLAERPARLELVLEVVGLVAVAVLLHLGRLLGKQRVVDVVVAALLRLVDVECLVYQEQLALVGE